MNLATFDPSCASDADILEAQRELAAAGYYHKKIDGDFGPKSRAALRTWLLTPLKSITWNDALRDEYNSRFAAVRIAPKWQTAASRYAAKIVANLPSYEAASEQTGVPAWVIGLIHAMEADLSFLCHLHNGDPLSHRTVNEPAGRPVQGRPPFDWTASAVDALRFDHFDLWHDWSVVGALYKLELYNGAGSRRHGVFTPYLWSGSQFYAEGKYVADGVWSDSAVSAQVGAAVILAAMFEADPVLAASLSAPVKMAA